MSRFSYRAGIGGWRAAVAARQTRHRPKRSQRRRVTRGNDLSSLFYVPVGLTTLFVLAASLLIGLI
jgi:hypothetical protein